MEHVTGSDDKGRGQRARYTEGHAEWLVDRQGKGGRWPRIRSDPGILEGVWRPTEGKKEVAKG